MSNNAKELPKIRVWKKDEMSKRIAFFNDLKGSKKGLPDSLLPECTRELINVIGFECVRKLKIIPNIKYNDTKTTKIFSFRING